MLKNAFDNLTGQQINSLRVLKIARRIPELSYECLCTICNTSGQTQTHVDLKSGKATCKSSTCGKEQGRQTRATANLPLRGVRTADAAEAARHRPTPRDVVQLWMSNNPQFIPNQRNVEVMVQFFHERNLDATVYENHDYAFRELRAAECAKMPTQ